jgi:hypothetical protein
MFGFFDSKYVQKYWGSKYFFPVKDSSKIKGQISKRKLIFGSPDLPLRNKTKIFILGIHKTSYGHLKVWSKMDKFDLFGIATQN